MRHMTRREVLTDTRRRTEGIGLEGHDTPAEISPVVLVRSSDVDFDGDLAERFTGLACGGGHV
jgi:hypothetical protein